MASPSKLMHKCTSLTGSTIQAQMLEHSNFQTQLNVINTGSCNTILMWFVNMVQLYIGHTSVHSVYIYSVYSFKYYCYYKCDIWQDDQISWCHDITFYTYIMQETLYAHDSMMMSVYDITEKHYKRGFLVIVYHRECWSQAVNKCVQSVCLS